MSEVNFQFQGPDCVGTYNLNVGFMQMGHLIISHITVIKSRTSWNTSLGGKNVKRRKLFRIPFKGQSQYNSSSFRSYLIFRMCSSKKIDEEAIRQRWPPMYRNLGDGILHRTFLFQQPMSNNVSDIVQWVLDPVFFI